MYYKVVMECGHQGAGGRIDTVWFMEGPDLVSVLELAKNLPGVKRRKTGTAIKLIKEITTAEFFGGIAAKKEALCSRDGKVPRPYGP